MSDRQLEEFTGPFAVLGPEAQEYLDILEENTGSREIAVGSLPVWRFPGSGGDEWVYEDATGQRHKTSELTGVVLAQRVERAMYLSDYSGGGQPPDCRSNDGIIGVTQTSETGEPINLLYAPSDGREVVYGGACAACPLNQWESAALIGKKGNGKACTEYRFGIIQRPGEPTPEGFRLPPTALKSWLAFGEQVSRARARLSSLVITLRLVLPRGASTAELHVEANATIPRETTAALKAIAPEIRRPQIAAPVDIGDAEPF